MTARRKANAGWQAGGSQGADISGDSDLHPTRGMRLWRHLARFAVGIACLALDRYALATDAPEPGIVEAADLLEAARAVMDGRP